MYAYSRPTPLWSGHEQALRLIGAAASAIASIMLYAQVA